MKKFPKALILIVVIIILIMLYFFSNTTQYSDGNLTQKLLSDRIEQMDSLSKSKDLFKQQLILNIGKANTIISQIKDENKIQKPDVAVYDKIIDEISAGRPLNDTIKERIEARVKDEFIRPIMNIFINNGVEIIYFMSNAYTKSPGDLEYDLNYTSWIILDKYLKLKSAKQVFSSAGQDDFKIKIKEEYDPRKFDNIRLYIVSDLSLYKNNWDSKTISIGTEIEKTKSDLNAAQKEIDELRSQSVTKIIIYIVLPLFGLLLILLYIIPMVYGDEEVRRNVFEKGILVQMSTVYLLTGTVIVLGLSKVIDAQVVGTLLGSISVYVLQKAADQFKQGGQAPAPAPVLSGLEKNLKWLEIRSSLAGKENPTGKDSVIGEIADIIAAQFPQHKKENIVKAIKESTAENKSIAEILNSVKEIIG